MAKFKGKTGEFHLHIPESVPYIVESGEGGLWSNILIFLPVGITKHEVEGTLDTVAKKLAEDRLAR